MGADSQVDIISINRRLIPSCDTGKEYKLGLIDHSTTYGIRPISIITGTSYL